MKRLVLVAATAAVTLAVSAPALARPAPVASQTFQTFDANKDGGLSWDEVLGAYPTLPKVFFNQADSDDDGVLDEAEFTSLQGLTAGFDTQSKPMPA